MRLDIRRTGQIKHGDETIGSKVRVKVVKNKCAPPFRQAEFEIMYGTGIHLLGEIVDLASTHGLLEKSGAWYILDGERVAQGRDRACGFLAENPEIADSLRERLMSAMRTDPDAPRTLYDAGADLDGDEDDDAAPEAAA